MASKRNAVTVLFGALLSNLLAGCLSPTAMHRVVLEYDRAVSQVEAELLLFNIARARHHRPVHFTACPAWQRRSIFERLSAFEAGSGHRLILPNEP
jgi:hypothetical protein